MSDSHISDIGKYYEYHENHTTMIMLADITDFLDLHNASIMLALWRSRKSVISASIIYTKKISDDGKYYDGCQ